MQGVRHCLLEGGIKSEKSCSKADSRNWPRWCFRFMKVEAEMGQRSGFGLIFLRSRNVEFFHFVCCHLFQKRKSPTIIHVSHSHWFKAFWGIVLTTRWMKKSICTSYGRSPTP